MIDGKTEIYGIIGNPVAHSLSPIMHNAAFFELGINAAYIPFAVTDLKSGLTGLKGLAVKGVSVTIPHKEGVIPFLDEIDPVAASIGAVNTIVVQREETTARLLGSNSDWQGANRALEDVISLSGRKVVILGAGGSARAMGFGLQAAGSEITLCSRTESRGRALADELSCPWCPLELAHGLKGDILINGTSVGMEPDQDRTPVSGDFIASYKVVMDIVYAPLKTRLLEEAERLGCTTVNGLEMLLYQGVVQFELWTGRKAPISLMRQRLREAVEARNRI